MDRPALAPGCIHRVPLRHPQCLAAPRRRPGAGRRAGGGRGRRPGGAGAGGELSRQAARQLVRLEEERKELATAAGERPIPAREVSEDRLQLALVEERMTVLRRMEVAAHRLEPTGAVAEALGPRPEDAPRAIAWERGADLICGFRQRHGISPAEERAFGPDAGGAARRRERREAERDLARVREALGRGSARETGRALEIDL